MRHAHLGHGRLQGRTLLLVDDERPVLQSVAAMLHLAGCQTLLAATGGDALALCDCHAERLAAVMLDLHLPGEDSVELFAALRARRPDLPIILTSGVSEAAAREHLGWRDVAGFLAKPFRIEQLLKTLEGVLEGLPEPADLPASPPEIAESRDHPAVHGSSGEAPRAAEPFEVWFPLRVAEAVRGGEVPEQVLSRLQEILEAVGDAAPNLPRLAAVREIANLAGIPPEQAAAVFGALQQLPGVAQEGLARRIAEAWLERQRSHYRTGEPGG